MNPPVTHNVLVFAIDWRVDKGKSAVIATLLEIDADHRARVAAQRQDAR